ncbi:MAG: GIY-YIG nuclease family protein [Candidatus Omnitrophica bacterium]|nr:GIY-YIG nuclease family protein [Candidatus Omnitrophota bacterium]
MWFVYIAECRDGTFYCGIAKDVLKRIAEHNSNNKCRYTSFRKPLVLKYYEQCENYKMARSRETEIKKFSRIKKEALIKSN